MGSVIATVVGVLLLFIALPVLFLWGCDKLFRRLPSKEKLDEHAHRFEHRLHHPDLEAIRTHFGHALPAALQALYEDTSELQRGDFDVIPPTGADPHYICFYNPGDRENVEDSWPGCEQYYAFADDGSGNGYMVDPRLEDPPVLFHDHETGEIDEICDTLSTFMR